MGWIDLHTHINMIKQDSATIVSRALANDVEKMILIGTDPEDMNTVLALAKKHYPTLFCTLGIHPHDSKLYTDAVENHMISLLSEPSVIGIGEIGLDYHYNHSPQEVQKEVFKRQLRIAEKFQLPIEIHTRDAEADTVEILKEFKGKVKGVLHCFTGSQWLADQALALGFDISLSGVCTFKNAEALRATIKSLPLDRIHIETDAPFMTPVPHRGKENEPALVVLTAKQISGLLGLSEDVLMKQLKKNAQRLFAKLLWS